MATKQYNSKRLRKAALATTIIFALMFIFTLFSWGVVSDWGNIRIRRINYIGEGGASQSALMFIPKNVSTENPAPAIINFHGRNCSSYSMINWAMEEARRGYIVMNPDRERTNETENTAANVDATILPGCYNYLRSLGIVDEISLTGHSAGTGSLSTLSQYEEIMDEVKAVVAVGGFFRYGIMPDMPIPTGTNWLIVEAKADLYANQWYGSYEAQMERLAGLTANYENFQLNTIYGSFEDGTAFGYMETGGTHQKQMYDEETICHILDFIGEVSPAPVELDGSDMVFPTFRIFSAICSVLFILFIGALAYTVTSVPLFYETITVPLHPSEGKDAKSWLLQVALDFGIPLLLFVPVTNWAAKQPTTIFKSLWVNQIFFWIVSVALVGAIILAVRKLRQRKTGELTALDFGTGTADDKIFSCKRLGAALGITLITVFVAFTWLDWVVKIFGVNYQFFCLFAQINRPTGERLLYIIPYLIVGAFLVAVINVNIATSRRMKTTGHETRDLIRDILVNVLLSAGPLTLLMAIEFIGIRVLGTGVQPFDHTLWGSLSFGWMFPFMMTSSAALSTFLYRKTGNIYTGIFVSDFALIFVTITNACISA